MDIQRRRYADGDKIHISDKAEIRSSGQHSFLHQAFQVFVHHISDIVVTFVDHLYLMRLFIETDRPESGFRLLHRQRQAHIAQTDHADYDLLFRDFIQ